jgi:putative membrane-bound dehydrogenase-like protein
MQSLPAQIMTVLGHTRFVIGAVLAIATFTLEDRAPAANLVRVNDLGLEVARGFTVNLYADAGMADDIYALTINPRGEVVVTGPGYIRVLIDEDQDGVADSATDFAQTDTGGMGLCFNGDSLLFVGDGGLWRLRDVNGDNQADGPAQKLIELPIAEHGAHAIRNGPDGGLYLMVGNETKLAGFVGPVGPTGSHPIEGGALLRMAAGGFGGFRVIAEGFRNAYDFDFNGDGDVFTYDSDAEADVLLPWYTPTRLFHVEAGGHHGWRLAGWKRSWARPSYAPDAVSFMAPLGRGSPTGVVIYRHRQFPDDYREGLFVLDWTFGRVYFAPLEPEGATYSAEPEVFLASTGSTGFAPTDIAVGLDGSLFVSTGGRRSKGGVYRIRYTAEPLLGALATNWILLSPNELAAVVDAPQPQDEWSRRLWVPLAQHAGDEEFIDAAVDGRVTPERRIRSIEVLTELFDGLSAEVAMRCAQANSPLVRARVAWSVGVHPPPNLPAVLGILARDNSGYVRCAALAGMQQQVGALAAPMIQQALLANLGHPEKRVRQAAALLATWLPDTAWNGLLAQQKSLTAQERFTLVLASLRRGPTNTFDPWAADSTLAALAMARTLGEQLEGVRLLVTALGDYNFGNPSAEVFTGYELSAPIPDPSIPGRVEKAVTPLLSSRSPELNSEVARVLAMMGARNPELPARLASVISPQTGAAADFHYLACLARLETRLPTNILDRVALAIVSLDRKVSGQANRPKQNWTPRLTELVQRLVERNEALATAILRQPEFVRPGNIVLIPTLGQSRRTACARHFFGALQNAKTYPWSAELVQLLSVLPEQEVHPTLRKQWSNPALREPLILALSGKPLPVDRPHFTAGLASGDPRVVQASMSALLQLPPHQDSLVPTLRALRRFIARPDDKATRPRLVALVNHITGQKFVPREEGAQLHAAYQPMFDWLERRYPGLLLKVDAEDQTSQVNWDKFLANVPWARGDADRGFALYQNRGCIGCHEGTSALGPDLAGVARRLSPSYLFNAILYPSRDIAAPYRAESFRLRNGENYFGRVTFESGEAIILQTGVDSTVRINVSEIASRQPSDTSFMPSGLLAGMSRLEFADLYAFLSSLGQ